MRYRIIIETKNNNELKVTAQVKKWPFGWSDIYDTMPYCDVDTLYPYRFYSFGSRQEALDAIDRHYGGRVKEVSVEYIDK